MEFIFALILNAVILITNMKKIAEDCYNLKGFDIYKAIHPKLYGKYEIYKGCDFISRALNLNDAKQIINLRPFQTQQ